MLKPNTRAVVHSTTSKELDGQLVKIRGYFGNFPEVTFYIIELETPVKQYDEMVNFIVLTSACIKEAE